MPADPRRRRRDRVLPAVRDRDPHLPQAHRGQPVSATRSSQLRAHVRFQLTYLRRRRELIALLGAHGRGADRMTPRITVGIPCLQRPSVRRGGRALDPGARGDRDRRHRRRVRRSADPRGARPDAVARRPPRAARGQRRPGRGPQRRPRGRDDAVPVQPGLGRPRGARPAGRDGRPARRRSDRGRLLRRLGGVRRERVAPLRAVLDRPVPPRLDQRVPPERDVALRCHPRRRRLARGAAVAAIYEDWRLWAVLAREHVHSAYLGRGVVSYRRRLTARASSRSSAGATARPIATSAPAIPSCSGTCVATVA